MSLGEVTDTKTRQLRSVRLLGPLAHDLRDWRAQSPMTRPTDLVFPRGDGTPWTEHDYKNWRRRSFAAAAKAAGVPGTRPYDLRHAFVSLLLAEGRSVLDIAAQAGHAPQPQLRHVRPSHG